MLVGMGNLLGTQRSHGYGFRQNFIPSMGMRFLANAFFLCRYGSGKLIPNKFLPIAISRVRCLLRPRLVVGGVLCYEGVYPRVSALDGAPRVDGANEHREPCKGIGALLMRSGAPSGSLKPHGNHMAA
jgi:hypothetical protein